MDINKIKIVALGSTRMVGKDTFCALLKRLNDKFKRVAFADSLKDILEPVCKALFGKSIAELTPEEKEIFRPIMISTGESARKIDKDFWVKRADHLVDLILDDGNIPVITDMRYLSEYNYFKNLYSDSFLFIDIERIGAPEPTAEEKIYAPELKKMADVHLVWETDISFTSLESHVEKIYNKYFNN